MENTKPRLDVTKLIKAWNEKFPEDKLTQGSLGNRIGYGNQGLSDLNTLTKNKPKWLRALGELKTIAHRVDLTLDDLIGE